MESKEDDVLSLFFNEPTKEWHFEEIIRESKVTRSKTARWLKRFTQDALIRKVKTKGKMPYYESRHDSPAYRNQKRLYALNRLYSTGFLNHLMSLPKARTIILFGSFARSDWYSKSDIDLFIYGSPEGLKLAEFELRLGRTVQVFSCHNQKEIGKFGEGFLKNILKGNMIKGDLDFVRIDVHA